MIAALVIAAVLAAPPVDAVFVLGEGIPPVVEVARLTRASPQDAWTIADLRHAAVRAGSLTLSGPAGERTMILIRVAGRPGYLLHGPFSWPESPAVFHVDGRWRRTIRGRNGPNGGLSWLSPDADLPPVFCEWTKGGEWECMGVPFTASGLVIRASPAGVQYSMVRAGGPRNDVEDVPTRSAAWGRLLVIQNTPEVPEGHPAILLRARALRLHRPPARPNTTRFEVAADPGVHVEQVGVAAFWVTGATAADDGWVELAAPHSGVARVPVAEISHGAADGLVPIALETPMAVFGRITRSLARPVPGTIVSLYRLGEQITAPDGKKQRLRIAVAEQSTNSEGRFEFDELLPERHEIVALHPAYGRGVRGVEPFEPEIEIVLKAPPLLRGRVVRQGVPQPGVRVTYVPDLATFAASSDPTELHGGEGRTDSDGRFRINAAAAGAGDVRIGSAGTGIKRVAIGSADSLPPITDLGDIELDEGIAVTIVFEDAGECIPLLTGPAGRAGLTVVRATRTGPAMFAATVPETGRWNLAARCGTGERRVAPVTIELKPGVRDQMLRLRWPSP